MKGKNLDISKIIDFKIETLPTDYSIAFKILKYTKVNKEINIFVKKDLETVLKDFKFREKLNSYEKKWCENITSRISVDEYIFDSSKSRSVVKKTIYVFYKKLKELQEFKVISKENFEGVDAICLGYPKCATTWFYNIAKQISLFDLGKQKEIEYFNSLAYIKGDKWYENHFTFDKDKISIDISVGYMNDNLRGIDRVIKYQIQTKKNIKFLLFVRKPSDRFISYVKYRMLSGRGFYNIKKYLYSYHAFSSFINSSNYEKDIEKLLSKGVSHKNIFVVFQEDIKKDSSKVFTQIYEYLTRKEISINDLNKINFDKKYNKGKTVRFFKLFKFIYDMEASLFLLIRKNKFLLYVNTHLFKFLKRLFISTGRSNDKLKQYSSSIEELKSLDKKYQNLKDFLYSKKINFSN